MSRFFVVEKGQYVSISNGKDIISFSSFDDFKKYYPELDLTGTIDLCYDTTLMIFTDSVENINQILENPIKKYEAIIEKFDELKANKENPYFNMSLIEAKQYKINILKQLAYSLIIFTWPEWKQININYSGTDEEKAKKDSDIKKIVDACNEMEEEINKLRTVNQVSKYEIAYPSLD